MCEIYRTPGMEAYVCDSHKATSQIFSSNNLEKITTHNSNSIYQSGVIY